MGTILNEPVSVSLTYNCAKNFCCPAKVIRSGFNSVHTIKKLGLHHSYKHGDTLIHVFSVISDTAYLKLSLNTYSLHWTLLEIEEKT